MEKRLRYCPFCYPETTVYYQDDTIAIIQDKYRRGKLIITRNHYPMTKEDLDEVFEIHAGTWHVSVDHMHIYYEPLSLSQGTGLELRPLELDSRLDLARRSLHCLSTLWLQEMMVSGEVGIPQELALRVWSRWGRALAREAKMSELVRGRGVQDLLVALLTLANANGMGGDLTGQLSPSGEGLIRVGGCPRWESSRSKPEAGRLSCHLLDDAFCQGFAQEFNPQVTASLSRSLPQGDEFCQVIFQRKSQGGSFR